MAEANANPTGSALSFAWKYRAAFGKAFVLALLGIVVLQNVEPTRVDVLFWSLPDVPKLVLIVVSGAVGAAIYALIRSSVLLRRWLNSSD